MSTLDLEKVLAVVARELSKLTFTRSSAMSSSEEMQYEEKISAQKIETNLDELDNVSLKEMEALDIVDTSVYFFNHSLEIKEVSNHTSFSIEEIGRYLDSVDSKKYSKKININHSVLLSGKDTSTLIKRINDGFLLLVQINNIADVDQLLSKMVVNAQEQERKRFALDVHDGLGQHLTGIKFLLNSLKTNDAELNEVIKQKCFAAIDSAIEESRNISFNLAPKVLVKFGLYEALIELGQRLESLNDVVFVLDYSIELRALVFTEEFKIAVYRIIQELCVNSIKHGHATALTLEVSIQKNQLKLNYSDNGLPFKEGTQSVSGMGLSNISYRTHQFAGQMNRDEKKKDGIHYQFFFSFESILDL